MGSSFLLSFREGLEAALIIGIIISQLTRIGRKDLMKSVYIGVLFGALFSAIGGFLSFSEAKTLEQGSEETLQAVMMILAAGLIAYFILWLHRNKNVSKSIQNHISNNTSWIGLFILSFLSVFREGMELVIFNLTQITQNSAMVAISSVVGITLAITLAYLIMKTSLKFNLKIIFNILGIVLIYIGGELFGEGLAKLFENGGETLETAALFIFIIPSLYILFKDDLKKVKKISVWSK